jgi:hypothetical protein
LLLIFAVLVSLLILYFSYKTLNHIINRISWVSGKVHLLSSGNFPVMVESIYADDEIGYMVQAILQANQAINEYNTELSESLKQQTIANTELAEARDKAVEMAIAKTQFLSNHES